MVSAGGAKKGYTDLENYDNIIVMSADRNGSTAFQQSIFKISQNQDFKHVWLGECFSNDDSKGLPMPWYDSTIAPKDVIEHFNKGTGKGVYLKIQITWPSFNDKFFEIPANRRIFLHRNLFDSTLSRCIGQLTGYWFTDSTSQQNTNTIIVPVDFFKARLEYRIDKYSEYIDKIKNWKNEFYRYETYNYSNSNTNIKKNVDKKSLVINYDQLFDIYKTYSVIDEIEKCLN